MAQRQHTQCLLDHTPSARVPYIRLQEMGYFDYDENSAGELTQFLAEKVYSIQVRAGKHWSKNVDVSRAWNPLTSSPPPGVAALHGADA